MTHAVLHIGFHKTGSTSIQAFLHTQRDKLAGLGVEVLEGMHMPTNHVELHMAAMQAGRMTPIKMIRNQVVDSDYRRRVKEHLRGFQQKDGTALQVYTAEGLSYLRAPDEFEWLREAIPGDVQVVAYLRDRSAYLTSYTHMIERTGFGISDDPASVGYVEHDSWLLDYEARLAPFRATFGHGNVSVIDFDAEVRTMGNVIPSFLGVLGVRTSFSELDWAGIRLNQRPQAT